MDVRQAGKWPMGVCGMNGDARDVIGGMRGEVSIRLQLATSVTRIYASNIERNKAWHDCEDECFSKLCLLVFQEGLARW